MRCDCTGQAICCSNAMRYGHAGGPVRCLSTEVSPGPFWNPAGKRPGLPGVPLQLEVLLKLQVHFTLAAVRHAGNTGRFFNYSSKCVAMPLLQPASGPWGQEVLRERYSEGCGQPGAEAGVRRLGAVLEGGVGMEGVQPGPGGGTSRYPGD